jgi:hypothetical protein
MNAINRKIVRRGLCVLGAVVVCAAGIRLSLRRSEANAPDTAAASAQVDAPVIVLDAGHGAST